MIRVILLCTAVASASVGGDDNTNNNVNSVAKREILEFYPDWVPFKNKHGDELGEFVDVNKSKAKVKKRLALPMNFLIKAISDDDSDYENGQGESDDDNYDDKKDWSDLHRPVFNASEPQSEQDKVSDIDGVINIITQPPSALADDINKSIQKEDVNQENVNQEDVNQEEIPETKENVTELWEENRTPSPELENVLTPKPNEPVYNNEEEDDSGQTDNQNQSKDQSQKLSPEEQKENEEKKKLILDSVDQLKTRHEEEQRAIAEKNWRDEYENEFRHKKKKNKRTRVKPTPPNYDEYEDMSWNNKYKIVVEKKPDVDTHPDVPVWEIPTENPKTTVTYKPADRSRVKYSLFRNPNLFTVDEEEEKIPAKKVPNSPRRFSSKYNSAKNVITPATTTEKVEPILYFPKKRQRKTKSTTTTRGTTAPDSYVAETVEDKLTKRTTEPMTYPDTSLGNDFITSTVSLWKDDVTSFEVNTEGTVTVLRDTTPQYDETAADTTGPSGEAQASNSDTVTDAVPASSDHKKEGPKDYHVEKGGGKEHHSSFEEEHEEHGKKAYEGLHKDTKTKQGHHDKEDHLGKYEDHGGHDKEHHDESGHYGAHHHEEHGKKHAKYEESGKHSKGHSTKGSHDIHKKEEYEKNVEFFEEEGDSAEEEKHGGYHNEKKHESGGQFKKGKLHADHQENKKGESGHFKKGHHQFLNKGHKAASGHEGHGKHHGAHHNAVGGQGGKKWVYHHGNPPKNANLIVIDRRADKYTHGPNYYG